MSEKRLLIHHNKVLSYSILFSAFFLTQFDVVGIFQLHSLHIYTNIHLANILFSIIIWNFFFCSKNKKSPTNNFKQIMKGDDGNCKKVSLHYSKEIIV